jgi:peptide-methionine (S)-S-oxide reductase
MKVNNNSEEIATFAAGCFWCVEAVFQNIKGVKKVVSGYSGGDIKNPSYEEVGAGSTHHAEAIQISYDPKVISYKNLLFVFWRIHDPTTANRQGADVGSQYRSAIFYHDEKQKNLARESKKEVESKNLFGKPIVTEIISFENFYPAEPYHQNYYKNNPNKPYCQLVIDPKIQKLKKELSEFLKKRG